MESDEQIEQAASHGLDVSHRGGKPGFVVVTQQSNSNNNSNSNNTNNNTSHIDTLTFPDYTGNFMFNTLGNLVHYPKCGLLFLDYDNGDTLQLVGTATIIWEEDQISKFPGAQRLVEVQVEEVVQLKNVLPFRTTFLDYSPHLQFK